MTPRELRDYWIITPDDAFPRPRHNGANWPVLVLALATAALCAWLTGCQSKPTATATFTPCDERTCPEIYRSDKLLNKQVVDLIKELADCENRKHN